MNIEKHNPKLADKYSCTGCMACIDSCAQMAISCIIDDEGHYTYNVDENKCILCHRCEKACPIVSEMQYGNNNLNLSKPYAAWTTNDEFRNKATSGGVFPAVAKCILEQNGVVFGAVQEQYYVHHEAIEQVGDIAKLQGSKYTQSKTEGIYQQVKESLNAGRKVLFSGVGCQVAALMSFLKGNNNLENLVTMDLICGGVPSSFLIKKYVEYYGEEFDSIISYRTKCKYELTLKLKEGIVKTIPAYERPFPIVGFTTGKTERYCCYECPFAKGHRISDITIGDFWGNTLFPKQNIKGVSVAIVHSDKGLTILQHSEIEFHEIGWRDFLPHNPRMSYGKGYYGKDRKFLSKAFANYNYVKLQEIYGNSYSMKHPISIVTKMLTILKSLLILKKRKQVIEQLLRENNL